MKTAILISLCVLVSACTSSGRRSGNNDDATGEPAAKTKTTSNDSSDKAKESDKTMSTRDRVAAWAGADAGIAMYDQLQIAGFELFWVTRRGPADARNGRGVAVRTGTNDILEGRAAMSAIMNSGPDSKPDSRPTKPTPQTLAQLSLLFLDTGGTPLAGPLSESHRAAGVVAPHIISDTGGDVLEYFHERRDMGGVELLRARLHLADLRLETEVAGGAGNDNGSAGDAHAQAQAMLASDNPGLERTGITTLVESCGDARAAKLLAATASAHKRPETRAEAALALGRCHDGDSVAVLMKVLANDREASVRTRAASALGVIGDATARPALEAALADSDAGVQYTAKKALKKLK